MGSEDGLKRPPLAVHAETRHAGDGMGAGDVSLMVPVANLPPSALLAWSILRSQVEPVAGP